jgi:hypothetical protein
LGKNGKNNANSKTHVNKKMNYQKIEITNFKKERFLLISKNLEIIIIIQTLNT